MYVEKKKSKLNSFEVQYKKPPSDLLRWGFYAVFRVSHGLPNSSGTQSHEWKKTTGFAFPNLLLLVLAIQILLRVV
jgi:hypothetical protein